MPHRIGRIGLAVAAVLAVGTLAAPASADVLPPGVEVPLLVTYAARVCDEYTDVMANKARNNLMESLRDLGPDTDYPSNGILTASAEQAGSPDCRPLTGWRMTVGRGYTGKTPATLELSTVTGAFGTDIVTQAGVPELDAQSNPTGRTLEGATTVALDATQAAIVRSGGKLWVQGGTPAAPLNGQQTTYGYAALRCAQDAVNGDNVEFVSFPRQQTHVFCYAYYVTPPPVAGTITVRKQLAPGSLGGSAFRFDGNLSYADTNGDGVNDFVLNANATTVGSQQFVRGAVGAGDPAWDFAEATTPGWQPTGPPVCTSTLGSPVTIAGQSVSVRLLADDAVVCTFTNERIPTGAETLSKLTLGAGGTFPFFIDVPAPGIDRQETAVTAGDGDQVLVAESLGSIPGTYTVTETLPAPTGAGSWELLSAICNGEEVPVTATGQDRTGLAVVGAGESIDCLVTNQFTPGGSITIRKATTPDTGITGFVVNPLTDGDLAGTAEQFLATATTTTPDTFTTAVWDGPEPSALVVDPASQYSIQEVLPAPSLDGYWVLDSVDCGANPAVPDLETASVVVTLTAAAPDAVCDFTNRFVPSGVLRIVKNATPDTAERPDAALIEVQCEPDTLFVFPVQPGVAAADSGDAIILGATRCRALENSTGAAPGVQVDATTTISVDGGPAVPLDPFNDWFDVAPGQTVVVTIDNTYVRSEPTPTPTPTPAPSPTGGIAATGSDLDAAPIAWAGIAALALGALLIAISRRRAARAVR